MPDDIVEHLCKVMHEAQMKCEHPPWLDWDALPERMRETKRVGVRAMLDDVAPRFLKLALDEIHVEQRWQAELSGKPKYPRLGRYGEHTHRYASARLRLLADSLKILWMAPSPEKEPVDG